MSLFKSYWTVHGISPNARDAAVRAAKANGEELGIWLSRLINKVSAAERNDVTVVNDSNVGSGDKLSSIERAMLQSGTTRNVESAYPQPTGDVQRKRRLIRF
ncbi:hypothetical protein OAJ57_03435 [Alphaproteobacteria bacterium]|nr:hypothetical protein [Alphaproteobacteria bacterium]